MTTAQERMLSARAFTAEEGLTKGLFLAVHPQEHVLNEPYRIAQQIVQHDAPVSIPLTRQMFWRSWELDAPMSAHRIETHAVNIRETSNDVREVVAAFLERRHAQFLDSVNADLPDIYADQPYRTYATPAALRSPK